MSDFSELCPLFNTGVYSEVLFPNIAMTSVSNTMNVLAATLTYSVTKQNYFTFGRTVVVTDAFIKCETGIDPGGTQELQLLIAASGVATMSQFAIFTMSVSLSQMNVTYTWQAMTVTSRTFTSTDVLCMSNPTLTGASAGVYSLLVRYREK